MKILKNSTSKNTQSDADLVALYQKHGRLEDLGDLYARYMPLVYGVCLNYFKESERSKDAVMQIFEELVSKLKAHQVNNFKSWLHVLTRNHCLMALRKDSRNPVEKLPENFVEYAPTEHLEFDALKEQQLSAMEKCMEVLITEQRTSVDLFYLQGKCYKEIVEITGYDILKVKSYIQNGKRNLKICIEKSESIG